MSLNYLEMLSKLKVKYSAVVVQYSKYPVAYLQLDFLSFG